MAADPLTVVRQVYAAFQRGDVAAVQARLSARLWWDLVGRPEDYPLFGPRRGERGAADVFRLLTANDDGAFVPDSFNAAGEVVLAQGREVFTDRRSGRRASAEWAHVFRVRDGKIVRFRAFCERGPVAEAWRA